MTDDMRASLQGNERRRVLRLPFVAHAEIRSTESAEMVQGYVTDLSLYGCYLDLIHPLPRGSEIFLRISTPTELFESRARVVYSHPNLGMGLAFRDVKTAYLPILRKWLIEAAKRANLEIRS
jgi:hypothetical protein